MVCDAVPTVNVLPVIGVPTTSYMNTSVKVGSGFISIDPEYPAVPSA